MTKELLIVLSALSIVPATETFGEATQQTPPFSETFDNPASCSDFIVIDANNDDLTFRFEEGVARIRFSQSQQANDWLVLPPLSLKEGAGYTFSCDAFGQYAKYPESFEVKMATEPTAESLASGKTIVRLTTVACTAENPYKAEAIFIPDADGVYYIGIHGCSEPEMFFLNIDNVAVSEGISPQAPAAVGKASAERDASGNPQVTIKFTAPDKDFSKASLSELDGVKILRDGVVIATTTPAAGAEETFVDTDVLPGEHVYTLIPFNRHGDGEPTKLTVFAGYNRPIEVDNLKAVLGDHDGQAILSWDAATHDITGIAFPAGEVSYKVMRVCGYDQIVLDENVTDTYFVDDFCDEESAQQGVYYTVVAVSSAGESQPTNTPYICMGASYGIPFRESFADELLQNSVWVTDGNCDISLYGDYSSTSFASQDSDNGCVFMYNLEPGTSMSLITGRILLDGVPDAVLSFYTLAGNYDSDTTLEVIIEDCKTTEKSVAATFDDNYTEDGSFRWMERTVSLGEWVGKKIRVEFRVNNQSYMFYAIDNIVLKGRWSNNLSVSDMEIPVKLTAGLDSEISVELSNIGTSEAKDYTVTLWRNNSEAEVLDGPVLAPGEIAKVTFSENPSSMWSKSATYYVTADYAADGEPNDNTTPSVEVCIATLPLPMAGTPRGEYSSGTLSLSWDEAVISDASTAIVNDGLADLTPFSCGVAGSVLGANDYIGDWSMVDADGLPTIGIGVDFPNSGLPMSFIVFNDEAANFDWEMFDDHSGDGNTFAAFASVGGRNNDWLISPALDGKAQTISFFAKPILPDMPERLEVYYSTSGKEPENFTIIGSTRDVSGEKWTEISCDLPEGALYFAVRYVSFDRYALLLDDFTYTPASLNEGLELYGYNVYVNDRLFNDSLLPQTSTEITNPAEGDKLFVTAVYNKGESAPTSPFVFSQAGVDDIAIPAVTVSASGHSIVIDSPAGTAISVADIAGRTIRSFTSCGHDVVTITPGMYIVTAREVTTKVVVR